MSDRLFLEWPFFDDSHRKLANELEEWCRSELAGEPGDDVDAECRTLVKKLGDGDLSVALQVTAHKFSATAKEKITAAGGTVTEL